MVQEMFGVREKSVVRLNLITLIHIGFQTISNPFLALKRHNTDENAGEAIGVSLVYSGNFRMQAEVDTHDVTRITAGINPEGGLMSRKSTN